MDRQDSVVEVGAEEVKSFEKEDEINCDSRFALSVRYGNDIGSLSIWMLCFSGRYLCL